MQDSELPYFTVRCSIEAVAYPLTQEPYLTQLLPGTRYSVLELTVETLTLGHPDPGQKCISYALRWLIGTNLFSVVTLSLPVISP